MKKNILPVGSVVLLEDSNKRLMIVGRFQKTNGSEKVFDYSGCLYPEGILDSNNMYLFDHEQINTVYFIGFQDYEQLEFTKLLLESTENRE